MEGIRELVEAFTSRVRSPVFGSIIVAFLVWNWQRIFVLVFTSGDIGARLELFTESLWALKFGLPINIVFPIMLGLVYFVVSPWLNLVAAHLVAKPTNRRRKLVDKLAVERAQEKAELAATLADAATDAAEAELRQREAEAELEAEKRREELAVRQAEIEQQAADAQLASLKREEEAAAREAEIAKREAEAAQTRKQEEGELKEAQMALEVSKLENQGLRDTIAILEKAEDKKKSASTITESNVVGFVTAQLDVESKRLLKFMRGAGETTFETRPLKTEGQDKVQVRSGRGLRTYDPEEFKQIKDALIAASVIVKDHRTEHTFVLSPLGEKVLKRVR